MKIICPTCNTSYTIPNSKVPKEKKAFATCKNCGAKIVIEPDLERQPDQYAHAEPESAPKQPNSATTETEGFEFLPESSGFRGYAGFWKRFVAAVIDGFILMGIGFLIGGFIGFFFALVTGTSEGVGALGNIAGLMVGWLYYALMESSSKQGTLGKMALGIKVTDLNGNRISFGRATARHFSKLISALILMIGYIMVAFSQKKQGLHDMIAGCLVVNSR